MGHDKAAGATERKRGQESRFSDQRSGRKDMGRKTLTVSIAAYQMEAYIGKTLASLCVEDVIGDLEIFVIDDGGTDGTMEIADSYAARYPESVFPVRKENGGYGSTVNYSLAHATGTYFRLLDGDDWVDSRGLAELVRELRNGRADVVMTDYYAGPSDGEMVLHEVSRQEGTGTRRLDQYVPGIDLNMWEMTVKTSVLRKCGLKLPEHMLYTDVFFVTMPLAAAETICYMNIPVYCYRTERSGQSLSTGSLRKHYPELISHSRQLAGFYEEKKNTPNAPVLLKKIGEYHTGTVRFLLRLPVSRTIWRTLRDFERETKEISPAVYREAVRAGKAGQFLKWLRRTGYLPYWLMGLRQGNER